MRKTGTVILAAIILIFTAVACDSTPAKEVNIVGDWEFAGAEGKAEVAGEYCGGNRF